jgi:hypothetical protein
MPPTDSSFLVQVQNNSKFFVFCNFAGEMVSDPVPCGALEDICDAEKSFCKRGWEGPNSGKFNFDATT